MRYFAAVRHPFSSLVFLLPLLAVYECGVYQLWKNGADPESVRNGADAWLRWALERYGLTQIWIPPLLITAYLLIMTMAKWSSRPSEPFRTYFGMWLESVAFAAGLWMIARNFEPLMERIGLPPASLSFQTPAAIRFVTFVGAGIYEELLFRVLLFGLLYTFLRMAMVPKLLALFAAALATSVLFAAAHNIGSAGEEYQRMKFLFRVLAGLYFTMLYVSRGLGIAVGAHAGYDILVGVTPE